MSTEPTPLPVDTHSRPSDKAPVPFDVSRGPDPQIDAVADAILNAKARIETPEAADSTPEITARIGRKGLRRAHAALAAKSNQRNHPNVLSVLAALATLAAMSAIAVFVYVQSERGINSGPANTQARKSGLRTTAIPSDTRAILEPGRAPVVEQEIVSSPHGHALRKNAEPEVTIEESGNNEREERTDRQVAQRGRLRSSQYSQSGPEISVSLPPQGRVQSPEPIYIDRIAVSQAEEQPAEKDVIAGANKLITAVVTAKRDADHIAPRIADDRPPRDPAKKRQSAKVVSHKARLDPWDDRAPGDISD